MPKVSVIVPVYGVEKYIERCARSLFVQTLDDIEFIFVDDCTTDRSMEILNVIIEEYQPRFAEMNYKVRIEKMPTNSGLPAVRKLGIQLATGDYIIHCDSDDWMDRDMYRKMYEKALKDHSDVVVCDYYKSNGFNKTICKGLRCTNKQNILSDLIRQDIPLAVWNKLVRRTLYVQPIEYPQNNMGEDMVLTIQLLYYASQISYVDKTLYYYFDNNNSITRQQTRGKTIGRINQALANSAIVCQFLRTTGLENEYKNELVIFKLKEKNFILPLIREREYYNLWEKTYPEVNLRLFLSPYISLKKKIKYALILCKLRYTL